LKTNLIFICTSCNKQLVKWMGRCPDCGEWNSIVQKEVNFARVNSSSSGENEPNSIVSLADLQIGPEVRLKTGLSELDRVLGGGVVCRSVILVGGDPGIGKSTLLMQALSSLAQKGFKVIYISGEESIEQLKLRADRLGIAASPFMVLVENELEAIIEKLEQIESSVIVLDSVQSIYSRISDSHAGNVSQVRHVASKMLEITKRRSTACFIIGHVTKDGNLAGPKVLEHMVDTVLYLEGERGHPYRILRAVKNRFGSVSEVGVFEMGDYGLKEVNNPSEFFLSERPKDVSGSAVTAVVEGSRPILAEIQALVTGPVHGQGRRTCLGTDYQRLALIIAVIEKKLGLFLGDQDIFVNAVGGVRAIEPASDLAIVAALPFLNVGMKNTSVSFGTADS